MSPDPTNFDDPALKAALKRSAGSHSAGSELRAKVADLLSTPQPVQISAHTTTPARDSRTRLRFAVAAALFLGVGIASLIGYRTIHERHEQQQTAEFLEENESLLKSMVIAAQATPTAAERATGANPEQELSTRVGHSVKVPDLSPDGWKLLSVSFAKVGQHPAARIEYSAESGRLVFLSLPASALAEAEEPDERYIVSLADQTIAGFVHGDTLYCFVAPTSLGLDMKQFLDRIRF